MLLFYFMKECEKGVGGSLECLPGERVIILSLFQMQGFSIFAQGWSVPGLGLCVHLAVPAGVQMPGF